MDDLASLDIQTVDYTSFFSLVPSFVSLDISKNSTGWVKWLDGVCTHGTFAITASDLEGVIQRQQFKAFLLELFGSSHFEYLFIEDVIGSVNFKTARVLYQLNIIPDDLQAEGLLQVSKLVRESNKVWKKNLKLASGFKSRIKAASDDKQITRDALHLLSFGDRTTAHIPEDVYDAVGMAVGVIYRLHVLKDAGNGVKLRTDITRGYKLRQFDDFYAALDFANDIGGSLVPLDFTDRPYDLRFNFKKAVLASQDDSKLYLITIPTSKIGALALNKGFDLTIPVSYLIAYR